MCNNGSSALLMGVLVAASTVSAGAQELDSATTTSEPGYPVAEVVLDWGATGPAPTAPPYKSMDVDSPTCGNIDPEALTVFHPRGLDVRCHDAAGRGKPSVVGKAEL